MENEIEAQPSKVASRLSPLAPAVGCQSSVVAIGPAVVGSRASQVAIGPAVVGSRASQVVNHSTSQPSDGLAGRVEFFTTCDHQRPTPGEMNGDLRRSTCGATGDGRLATCGATGVATRIIGPYGGYRKMLSFGLTCLVYHATTLFCKRNYNYKNDALGKTHIF